MTVNKIQGQSLKNVGLDLRTPVFSHGQLYVGLSRCTSGKVLLKREDGGKTSNIVFKEILTGEKTIQKPQFLHFNPGFPKCLGRNPGFSLHSELRIFKVRFS